MTVCLFITRVKDGSPTVDQEEYILLIPVHFPLPLYLIILFFGQPTVNLWSHPSRLRMTVSQCELSFDVEPIQITFRSSPSYSTAVRMLLELDGILFFFTIHLFFLIFS